MEGCVRIRHSGRQRRFVSVLEFDIQGDTDSMLEFDIADWQLDEAQDDERDRA
jgi:hypothetical protein